MSARWTSSSDLKSTQEGMAKIPPIPKGKILIQIIAKNYQTYGETYDIDDDERQVDIVLRSEEHSGRHGQDPANSQRQDPDPDHRQKLPDLRRDVRYRRR